MLKLFRYLTSPTGKDTQNSEVQDGFVYVPEVEPPDLFVDIKPNSILGNSIDTPPWIVVDRTLQSIVLARWPGRIWAVHILKSSSNQPKSYAGYTRATCVKVLHEVRLSELFEHNGPAVLGFLDQVSTLKNCEAENLGRTRDEDAARIYNQVWDRWLEKFDPASIYAGNDHKGVIRIGHKPPVSPVGNALSVLQSQLSNRAREIYGDDAFVIEDDEISLNETWLAIADNLHHALFSIGAGDDLVSTEERIILARTWNEAKSAE
ncbi:hypothetical protein [Solilutibacter silvestris]|uniref:hypothetical protein n=1 Tax=Solilutibacter silvestris TaxID=1645665 RepID=UPI003D32DEBC